MSVQQNVCKTYEIQGFRGHRVFRIYISRRLGLCSHAQCHLRSPYAIPWYREERREGSALASARRCRECRPAGKRSRPPCCSPVHRCCSPRRGRTLLPHSVGALSVAAPDPLMFTHGLGGGDGGVGGAGGTREMSRGEVMPTDRSTIADRCWKRTAAAMSAACEVARSETSLRVDIFDDGQ